MPEPIMDDKGKVTPADNVPDKKPAEVTLEELQEQFKNLSKKLEDKEEQARQLTEELRKVRFENKQPLIIPPVQQKPDISGDDEPDDIDAKVDARLNEEKKANYVSRVNRCFDKFSKGIDDWDIEIENKFRTLANRTYLGDSEDEVMENFQLIYNGIIYPRKAQSKEEDNKKTFDVGDGGNDPTNKNVTNPGKINWLTKKLNKYEQEAARRFTGGETAYRKKKQEMENSR